MDAITSPILRHQSDAGTYTDQDNVLRDLARKTRHRRQERVKITKDAAADTCATFEATPPPGIQESVFLAEYGSLSNRTRCRAQCVLAESTAARGLMAETIRRA